MLSSPGNSPRHLSFSPSPSQTPHENPNSTTPATTKRNSVLDEDTYVASIEKIIERDFFPDIPKLRDRLDWLQAVRTGDPILIKDAQLKILERRGGVSGGRRKVTQTVSRTPGTSFSITPFEFEKTPLTDLSGIAMDDHDNGGEGGGGGGGGVDGSIDVSLSLDEFFRRYTSEDNESFCKIMDKVNRKRKERFGYLTQGEEGKEVKSLEDEKRERVTDGYGTSDQPGSTLEGWKYTAKNLLMYNPADNGEVSLTEEERDARIKALTKEISRTNTRFHGEMVDSSPKEEDTIAMLYTPVKGTTPFQLSITEREAEKMKKYDLEDMRKTPNPFYVESVKKSDKGYSYVKTPSPAPGVVDSPFMTWGEIEGTPLRLEMEDTPVGIGGSGSGPHFSIPCPPPRDLKAHSLSREAARKLRQRSNLFRKPPLPSPARGGSASPSVRTLSPAAQKFVRNAIAKSSCSVDETLRASYRGASPSARTPKAGSLTRFSKDGSLDCGSPSVREEGF